MTREKEQFETVDLGEMANKTRFNSLYFAFTMVVFNYPEVFNKRKHVNSIHYEQSANRYLS